MAAYDRSTASGFVQTEQLRRLRNVRCTQIYLSIRFSIGVKWIKQKYGEELRIVRPGQKGYLETIEKALTQGLF